MKLIKELIIVAVASAASVRNPAKVYRSRHEAANGHPRRPSLANHRRGSLGSNLSNEQYRNMMRMQRRQSFQSSYQLFY